MSSNTIAAIATASGVGSIAIIRLSGEQAIEIANKVIDKELTPRVATLSSVYNKENILIDQAIVIYFKSPNSFTGEDIVEFQCHGGAIIAQEILDSLVYFGAKLAKPGEFTQRAFLNGKIDLTKAEAIAKMIETKSLDGAKILARQLRGELGEFINKMRDSLLLLLSYSEVMIDYAQEDIDENLILNLESKLKIVEKELEDIVNSTHRRMGLIEGFWLSIIGKPNVGKSSILNKMLNYNRAIVSDIAGTTRDSIEEQVKIGSHIVRVADTAGIREATDIIEKLGVERSIEWLEKSDIVVAVFDASNNLDDEDLKVIELIKSSNTIENVVVVLNKIDISCKIDKSVFSSFDIIELSAKESVDILIDKLEDILNSFSKIDELMLISNRQVESVNKALSEIRDSFEPLKSRELEFFSYHINIAIEALNELTRPYRYEEMLDKMFSEFCLGK